MKILILMDKIIPLGDTRYVFRISKFVILTFFNIFRIRLIELAFCYLRISLTGQNYLRTFDVIFDDFLG